MFKKCYFLGDPNRKHSKNTDYKLPLIPGSRPKAPKTSSVQPPGLDDSPYTLHLHFFQTQTHGPPARLLEIAGLLLAAASS